MGLESLAQDIEAMAQERIKKIHLGSGRPFALEREMFFERAREPVNRFSMRLLFDFIVAINADHFFGFFA